MADTFTSKKREFDSENIPYKRQKTEASIKAEPQNSLPVATVSSSEDESDSDIEILEESCPSLSSTLLDTTKSVAKEVAEGNDTGYASDDSKVENGSISSLSEEKEKTENFKANVRLAMKDRKTEFEDGEKVGMKQCKVVCKPIKFVTEDDDEIEVLESPALPCRECGQYNLTVTRHPGGPGLREAEAVREERISVLSWEDSIRSDFPPCFKVENVSIFDSENHLVGIEQGLVEAGSKLYMSGTLVNIVDSDERLEVEKVGPLIGWRRCEGESLAHMRVLQTRLEGITVEYHCNQRDYSQLYRAALAKAVYSVPPRSRGTVDPKLSALLSSLPSSLPTEFKQDPASKKSVREVWKTKRVSAGSSDEDYNPEKDVKSPRKRLKPNKYNRNDDGDDTSSGDSYFVKQKQKVPTILKSFGRKTGYGEQLVSLLPAEYQDSADAVAAFLLFILERQTIWVRKQEGKQVLTRNEVMAGKWFTNMYRELDRGTLYFRRAINRTDLKGFTFNKMVINESLLEKVLFKSIIYRLINKVETFMDYGRLPSKENFSAFLKYLNKKKSEGAVIFTAAHQNMGLRRLLDTFEFVRKNIGNLAKEVVAGAKRRSMKDCQNALLKMPNVGDFFAWQILCDLLESRLLGENTDNQWATLGPGAKNGLRRIFPLPTSRGELRHTRMLRDLCAPAGSKSGYQALGLSFPAFLDKPLSLKNVEHALCEYDKYFRSALGVQVKEREYSVQKSRTGLDELDSCGGCANKGTDESVKCVLCGVFYHKFCEEDWAEMLHRDGSWLCTVCQAVERIWTKEDFQFEEVDRNDDMAGKAYQSLKAKTAARLKRQGKKQKNSKQIECIDLSSDSEDEEVSDDEVECLEEVEGHFFGINFDDSVTHSDEENDDPFAGVGYWETENAEATNLQLDEREDCGEEISILS